MRNIQKLEEPNALVVHKCQRDACYENMPAQVRNQIIFQLLQEQGYLCAYCMCRISRTTMKVEHVASRFDHLEKQLTYSNLVACCQGNEGHPHNDQHCDTYKGSKTLSKNPAIPQDRIEETIQYNLQGQIFSTDRIFNNELNQTLNLNIPKLCNNRKAVHRAVIANLSRLPQNANRRTIQRLLENWENRDCDNKLKEYAGVALYFIKKRLAYAN